jgi:hypothetical protein
MDNVGSQARVKKDGVSIRGSRRAILRDSNPFEAVVAALKAALGSLDLVEFAKVAGTM